jgi:hypothetical protein
MTTSLSGFIPNGVGDHRSLGSHASASAKSRSFEQPWIRKQAE